MQIALTSEQEQHLGELVERTGKQPGELILEAADFLFADYRPDLEAVECAVVQADAGIFIEEEEMDIRFEKMIR